MRLANVDGRAVLLTSDAEGIDVAVALAPEDLAGLMAGAHAG